MTGPKSKIVYSNGATYSGETFEGKKQGRGLLQFKDGSKYEGPFKDDLQDGQGEETWMKPNGEFLEKYKGEFKNGKRHGKGQVFLPGKKKAVKVVYNEGNLITGK